MKRLAILACLWCLGSLAGVFVTRASAVCTTSCSSQTVFQVKITMPISTSHYQYASGGSTMYFDIMDSGQVCDSSHNGTDVDVLNSSNSICTGWDSGSGNLYRTANMPGMKTGTAQVGFCTCIKKE